MNVEDELKKITTARSVITVPSRRLQRGVTASMGDALLVFAVSQRCHQSSHNDDTLAAVRLNRKGDDGRHAVSGNGALPDAAGRSPAGPRQRSAHR